MYDACGMQGWSEEKWSYPRSYPLAMAVFLRDNDDSPVDIVAPKYFHKPGSLMVKIAILDGG